jgi:electron transfer flavoprotein alpha subunit
MIIGLVEHDGVGPDRTSLEMLTVGRQLAAGLGVPLEAVLLGPGARSAAEQLAAYGVSRALVVEHDRLDDYAPAAWAQSLVQLAGVGAPEVVMASGTDRGNEVLAHVGGFLGLAMAANCTEVQPGDPFLVTRQRWGGSLLEDARLDGPLKLLTVAEHAALPEEVAAGATIRIEPFTPTLSEADLRVRVVSRVAPEIGKISLADARVVVGGGRGVGSAEGFAGLEELAGLLGAAVGVSRVVTSAGWRPHAQQVGQTGTRIAPDLYIACGISGAIQHIVGCKAAKTILAINTDAEAPIMARASYAVIGDLHAVVPALCAEIRRVTQT